MIMTISQDNYVACCLLLHFFVKKNSKKKQDLRTHNIFISINLLLLVFFFNVHRALKTSDFLVIDYANYWLNFCNFFFSKTMNSFPFHDDVATLNRNYLFFFFGKKKVFFSTYSIWLSFKAPTFIRQCKNYLSFGND